MGIGINNIHNKAMPRMASITTTTTQPPPPTQTLLIPLPPISLHQIQPNVTAIATMIGSFATVTLADLNNHTVTNKVDGGGWGGIKCPNDSLVPARKGGIKFRKGTRGIKRVDTVIVKSNASLSI